MNELTSLWDGWTKQCFGAAADYHGKRCATRYASLRSMATTGKAKAVTELYERVAGHLRTRYDIPATFSIQSHTTIYTGFRSRNADVIIYANDVLRLTPDDFRRIDLETQIAAAVEPLVESANELLRAVEPRSSLAARG